ncbi:hypothetical protein GCM10023215_32780 [Pseudonocardia yuanmonensis]|uniref:DUF2243 domain-containing protein n=1 Tax=Pseudonocardia yuanmonensis TaxID=1095914 RepID=A0ABP8WS85_9PSEU
MAAPTTGRGAAGAVAARAARRNVLAGVLLGLGAVAFLDEAVFHQLLHWHHFYDRASSAAGLVSDGIFHAFSWFATVAAWFLIAALRRDRALRPVRVAGGALAGGGAFQLYDGLVQHKLLGLHQIRYVPDLLVYDVMWNVLAVVLLVVGLVLLVRTRERRA